MRVPHSRKQVAELFVHRPSARRGIESRPHGLEIVLHHLGQYNEAFKHLLGVGAGDPYLTRIESHARRKVPEGHTPKVIRQGETKSTRPRHRFCALMFRPKRLIDRSGGYHLVQETEQGSAVDEVGSPTACTSPMAFIRFWAVARPTPKSRSMSWRHQVSVRDERHVRGLGERRWTTLPGRANENASCARFQTYRDYWHTCYLLASAARLLPTTMPIVVSEGHATLRSATAVAPWGRYQCRSLFLPRTVTANSWRRSLDVSLQSQTRAALAVSRELVLLYWSIGREILIRQEAGGWGAKVIERLGHDLGVRFPGVEGFSTRNLKYMRSLAEAWPDPQIVPQRVALLPWGHLRLLLDRVKEPAVRDWYLAASVEYGWSRNILAHMLKGNLHERQGKALTNFKRTLPSAGSDMAEQVLRDPYNFDFLTLREPFRERELERGLLVHLRNLLLELGRGFAFIGSQVPIAVGDSTFYLDLLFYHVRLHCFFVVELKTGAFEPEYAGKLNFYLSAVDGLMRTERDDPTIGLLLCESHDGPIVELSFKDVQKPIGVSTYTRHS